MAQAAAVDLPGTTGNYISTPDSPAVSLAGANILHLPGITGNYASTPDSAAVSITGAIDVRAMVALDDWSPGTTQALVAKYGTSGNRSWRFFVDTVGSLRITLSQDGAATSSPSGSSVNLSATPPGGWVGLRFTWDPATSIVRYYTAPYTNDPNAAVWTQLGIDRTETLGYSSLHDNTQQVEIGTRQTGTVEPLAGNVAWAEIRNGIDGTVVAKFDPSTISPTSDQVPTTLVSSTGETWTMNGTKWNWRRDNEVRTLRLTGVSGVNASAPDSTALSITGDIDLRAKVSLDDWTPAANRALVAKWINGSPGNQSYYFQVLAAGTLRLITSADGTATVIAISTVAPTVADGAVLWLRVTRDVDNGAAGNDTKFYTSTDGITWVQLGTTVTVAGATTISDNTQPVRIGTQSNGTTDPLTGNIYYAEIRNNILNDGTGIVANPSFENQPWDVGDTSGATGTDTAAVANTWTLNGASIIQRAFASDLDIRVKVAMDDWTPAAAMTLASKWGSSGQRSWRFLLRTDGLLQLIWTVDGNLDAGNSTSSPATTGGTDGAPLWVRVTLSVATTTTTFYTSADGVIWAQIDQSVVGGVTSIFDSTAPVELGSRVGGTTDYLAGDVYYAEIRNGIAGTVVAYFDPTEVAIIGTRNPSVVTMSGTTWTVNGSAWDWIPVGVPEEECPYWVIDYGGVLMCVGTAGNPFDPATSNVEDGLCIVWC